MAYPPTRSPGAGRLALTVLRLPRKIAAVACGAVLVVIAALLLAVQAAYLGREGREASAALVILGCGLALVALLDAFVVLVWVLRNGAWLEGTTLVVRTSFTTRRSDLATVPVRLGRYLGKQCLIASDSISGRAMRLMIGGLPAPELAAVAGAIMAGGRRDPDSWQLAGTLRQQAAWRQAATPPGYPGYRIRGG